MKPAEPAALGSNFVAMGNQDVDDAVTALLRVADQRYTAGRRRLVAALQQGEGPLTITQIVSADASLAQSSVYRNLTLLEDAGAVTRIVTNDEFARYELAEELTEHHHHMICTRCGDVLDFELDARTEEALHLGLERAAKATGFTTTDHRLDLIGFCATCASGGISQP